MPDVSEKERIAMAKKLLTSPQYQSASPEVKQALVTRFKETYKVAAPSITESTSLSRPGFLQRFGEASGVPTSWEQTKQLIEGLTPQTSLEAASPIASAAYKIAKGYGKQSVEAIKGGTQEVREAIENIRKGQPVGANLGKAVYGQEKALMTGPLAPFGGGSVWNFGEDVAVKNYLAAAGGAAGLTSMALLSKLGRKPSTAKTVDKLAYATSAPADALAKALPDITTTVKQVGAPKTVGDMAKVIDTSVNRLETEFNTALQPIASRTIVPTEVSNAIRARITPAMQKTAQGRALARRLESIATDYETTWNLRELNDQRVISNKRLRSFYGKGSVPQSATLRTEAQTMADKAIADTTRDIVYKEMETYHKRDFTQLKQRESSLLSIKENLDTHVEKLRDLGAKQRGAPFFERHRVRAYVHPSGAPGVVMHPEATFMGSEAKAASRLRKAFRPASRVPKSYVYSFPIRESLMGDTQ